MHWLAGRLEHLRQLRERYDAQRGQEQPAVVVRKARAALHQALREVADDIAAREGVTASFVAHDGFVLANAGAEQAAFEALAATAQQVATFAQEASNTVALGDVSQTVIIGEAGKLVLFPMGGMVVGILSPPKVSLAKALSR